MAWVVLWTAFAVFWVLVIGSFFAAKRYYDTASIAQTATLTIEEGIVLFRDAVSSTLVNAHDNLLLREGDVLLVGQGARASITLFDGSSVRLLTGSELRLTELRRSRFHDGFTRLGLNLTGGTARIEVGASTAKGTRFLVTTPHGSALLSLGDFGFEVAGDQTRVSSRVGSASVAGKGGATVMPGEKALLGRDGVQGPYPEGDQLVLNGDFSQGFGRWKFLDVNEEGRALEPGQRMLVTTRVTESDVVAMRVVRNSLRSTHNETGLSQAINKDVSDYRSLLLNADVRVDEQSLSGGGYLGYEYPAMIRVRYRDETGGQIDWSHGFFHKNPENRPTPNGEWVPQARWISYSGNLMEIEPRPQYILSVEVLGAGHSFDAMIANIELTGK